MCGGGGGVKGLSINVKARHNTETHFFSRIWGHGREAFIPSSELIKTSSQNVLINEDDARLVISVDIPLPSWELIDNRSVPFLAESTLMITF